MPTLRNRLPDPLQNAEASAAAEILLVFNSLVNT